MKQVIIFTIVLLLGLTSSCGPFDQTTTSYSYAYNIPCRECSRMAETLNLTRRGAEQYYKVIHKSADKIEKIGRNPGRDLIKAERRINDLRRDRDSRVERLIPYSSFNHYLRIAKDTPERVHDRRKWFNVPTAPNRPNRPSRPPRPTTPSRPR